MISSPRPGPAVLDRPSGRRLGLFALATGMAVSAFGGSLGLMWGFLDLGDEVDARLPFGSPVLAGLALAVIVCLPSTVVAVLAWTGDARAAPESVALGWLIIGWIAVEAAFIREFSFLQVIVVACGLGFLALGRRRETRPP